VYYVQAHFRNAYTSPVGVDPDHEREIQRWSDARVTRLTSSDGWLTLVGLEWLTEGENPVGSDPSDVVRLPAGGHVGSIEVRDGAPTLRAVSGSGLTHEGRPVSELTLADDADTEPPVVHLGSLRFHVIRRAGRLAVRIRDVESPARQEFAGIERYPVDTRWRIDARFEPYDPPRQALAPNVVGLEEEMEVPGVLRFDIDGEPHELLAFTEAETDDLFIVFGDRTNEDETYGGGRYLYAPPPGSEGATVLDFNKAYNPPCVFTPYATCVLPLPENRLPIRIEAGEKAYPG
jgi:uncharacterized protein